MTPLFFLPVLSLPASSLATYPFSPLTVSFRPGLTEFTQNSHHTTTCIPGPITKKPLTTPLQSAYSEHVHQEIMFTEGGV